MLVVFGVHRGPAHGKTARCLGFAMLFAKCCLYPGELTGTNFVAFITC